MPSEKLEIKANLRSAIQSKNLSVTDVGKVLFPGASHPYLAMNRVLNKKQLLNSYQISQLSKLLDIPVEELC